MIDRHLFHRCKTARYAETAQGYGKQRTPAPHLSDVHCRLKTTQQRGFNSVTGHFVETNQYSLQVLFHEDIIAGDQVTNLVDEYGNAMPGTFEAAGVVARRGHTNRLKVVSLNKVS